MYSVSPGPCNQGTQLIRPFLLSLPLLLLFISFLFSLLFSSSSMSYPPPPSKIHLQCIICQYKTLSNLLFFALPTLKSPCLYSPVRLDNTARAHLTKKRKVPILLLSSLQILTPSPLQTSLFLPHHIPNIVTQTSYHNLFSVVCGIY